ncbi:molybdopterin-dependent oxidoreductase [bacterium]|nr:molybdopterin-dependent oxidoreductase [bacterium]MDC0287898.1 molybdopterin-dependent oxidoreductase [Rubripirellula sp.]
MITRREMLLASGGIVIAGGTLTSSQAVAEEAKQLVYHTTTPNNAEPKLDDLVKSWITPTKHFYVRSHAPNPIIEPAGFELKVEGMVNRPASLSLKNLERFKTHSTTATLTCAGNRRSEFNAEGKVGGVQWQSGAIGNATWQGVALADVLKEAEVMPDAKYVWFEGLDEIEKGGGIIPFGGSIPIAKAMIGSGAGAPLLAHGMNGAPLTADHGFPLRTLVPGYIGARSVKWLGRVVVSDRPSPNHYVATAYKLVKNTDPIDWAESGPIYRYPINSAICTPKIDSQLAAGEIDLTGYVLPTGRPGTTVKKVLVSADQGKRWTEAAMVGKDSEFCWQLWSAKVNVTAATKRLMVRAFDSSGGFMPYRVPWNAKGYLQNSWYKLPVQVN